jgi:acetoin utilization deacetylase AcuC-like enzyme
VTVGCVYDLIYLEHDTGHHPENGQRLAATVEHLQARGLFAQMTPLEPHAAAVEDLARVHDTALIDRIRALAEAGGGHIDADTVVGRRSFEVARMAAGGTLAAAKAVLSADVDSALALVRPPGHHATPGRAMGFCLFNNIAVAAAWALSEGGVERLAIVDYDVHHGNGTQAAFERDPRVLYISLHQYPFYPGTGHWREVGAGEGRGTCINVPLPPHTGDAGYASALSRLVAPALARFGPQLILVSAGFDGHWADPLAWMLLSVSGYRRIVETIATLAGDLADGRLALVLEGGYHPTVLAHSVASTVACLLGQEYEDELGPAPERESSVEDLISRIARHHGLQTTSSQVSASHML